MPHCLMHLRVHELDKRVLSLPTFSQIPPTMAVSCAFLCAVKSHTSILFGSIDSRWDKQ